LTQTLTKIDLKPVELFAATYLPHYLKCDVPLCHREIYAAYSDRSIDRLTIRAPRDWAKSTTALIYFLWEIAESKDVPGILAFSRSKDLGTRWTRKIKHEIESNYLLCHDYGLSAGEPWSSNQIVINRVGREPFEFKAFGKGSSARGFRGNVFIDDPQDKGDTESEAIINADENWLFEDVLNILEPGQRLIFIGTRISPISLLSKAVRIPSWKHLSYKAIEDGKSTWPSKWSMEAIEQRKDEIGIDRFNSEFMDMPRISENPIFKNDWFRPYDRKSAYFQTLLKQGVYTVTACDPAISKRDTADYTGIVTVSATMTSRPEYFIRDVRKSRWSMSETSSQLFQVFDAYKQSKTVVESVAYQQALMEEINHTQEKYRQYINPYPIEPDRDKARRAYAVQSLFQEGRVYFDFEDKGTQQLMDELLLFSGMDNSGYHDDLVDAMVYALSELKQWSGRPVKGQLAQASFNAGIYGG